MTAVEQHPPSLGEPITRRDDKDAEWGYEVWSVLCTTCGYSWYGKAWESCLRCIERLEADHGPHDEYQADPTPKPEPPAWDDVPISPDDELNGLLLDWGEFWSTDHKEAEWIVEPILAARRSTAMFAPGGTGKSLLALYMAACVATGRPVFGRRTTPMDVLYLDYEMTADDLAERLEQMGFGADVDLGKLHYALLPSLPGLDEPEGGKAVVRLAELVDAGLVIIDTFGRAVHGDENDADTVRSFYRWTGLHLKHDGRAFLRVDHAGKDVTKGQRGTSAKNDDVDVVWQMAAKDDNVYTLTAKKRRMGWVPLSVDIVMREDDQMSFELLHGVSWPAGTKEVADELERLGVPVDMSQRAAHAAFKEAGGKRRADVIRMAQKYRREAQYEVEYHPGNRPESASQKSGRTPSETDGDAPRDAPSPETASPQVDDLGRTSGRTGTHPADATGTQCVTRRGTHASSVPPEPLVDLSTLEF